MPGMTFNIDIAQGLKKLRNTTPGAKRALVRAVNGGLLTARAQAAREIAKQGYRFKVSTIKSFLKLEKATTTGDEIVGSIRAVGRPIPLIKFDVQPAPVRRGDGFARPAVGIYATVNGREFGDRHAFYARVNTGKGEHVGVFVRVGVSRLPIKQLFGPSVPDGLANQAVQDALQTFISERFPRILQQESAWLRRRLGGSAA